MELLNSVEINNINGGGIISKIKAINYYFSNPVSYSQAKEQVRINKYFSKLNGIPRYAR